MDLKPPLSVSLVLSAATDADKGVSCTGHTGLSQGWIALDTHAADRRSSHLLDGVLGVEQVQGGLVQALAGLELLDVGVLGLVQPDQALWHEWCSVAVGPQIVTARQRKQG